MNLYRQCTADQYPYTIQRGDTLNSIAARLGVNVRRIIEANPGVDPANLQVGQVICIPPCLPNQTLYTIQRGDTLYRIAQQFNVSIESILAANPSVEPNYLRVGQRICIPVCPANHRTYIIQRGDTLYRIAQEFNVSINSILAANPSVEPNYLRVGQRICIPPAVPELDCETIVNAMQRDIDMLKADSNVQQTIESNYGDSTQTTTVREVTESEIQFEAAPIFFPGNYIGRFTVGRQYPYYMESAMGGRRLINVRDNYGVWHAFRYQLPMVP